MIRVVSGIIFVILVHHLHVGDCDVSSRPDSTPEHHQAPTPDYPNSSRYSTVKNGLHSSFVFLSNFYPMKKSKTYYASLKQKYINNASWGRISNLLQAEAQKNKVSKKGTIKWPFSDVDFKLPIQSPVDVITSKLVERKELPELQIFEPHLSDVHALFYNSGHTAYVYIEGENHDVLPSLAGGPLPNKFVFEQMHFHWGREDEWGSEHMIDGEAFAVEIHLVHYNSKYNSFTTALENDDGLAVLTIFAEITNEDNKLLKPLYNFLPMIKEPKTSASLHWDDAMQWAISALGSNTEFYTYPGSLTTPDYNQNVAFIILPKPITISHDQVRAFRELHSEHEHGYISDNKRNLQPLHHRPLLKGRVAPEEKSILEMDE